MQKIVMVFKIIFSLIIDTAIRNAAENGHLEIVKLLLQDNRVDPSARDNYLYFIQIP